MNAQHITAIIQVSNLKNALAYYTDILGFKSDFEYSDYAGLHYNHIGIHLSGPTHQGIKKEPGSALFSIYCDDINVYYSELVKKGALITSPIASQSYGLREFVVVDEDGNTLVFGMDI